MRSSPSTRVIADAGARGVFDTGWLRNQAASGTIGGVPPGRQVLAIDIGGTKVAVGVVDDDGRLTARHQEPTAAATAEQLYDQLLRMARATLATCQPVAVGVGCGGPARDQHRLLSPLNIGVWRDFALRERLERDLELEVHVDNDAKALALAEGWVGAAKGVSDYLAMVVSTGVGGGIVLGGRLLDGADGNAGHIGHVFVEPDGGSDALGVRGLLEGSASGTALAARLGEHPGTAPIALRRQVGVWVGRAVASVANLLDLQLAVVAGSVALGYGDDFFHAAQATLDELCRLDHSRGARIVAAGLADAAPLVGAGAVGFRGLGVDVLG